MVGKGFACLLFPRTLDCCNPRVRTILYLSFPSRRQFRLFVGSYFLFFLPFLPRFLLTFPLLRRMIFFFFRQIKEVEANAEFRLRLLFANQNLTF